MAQQHIADAAPLIVQVLTAVTLWPQLTPTQRGILTGCLRKRTAAEPYTGPCAPESRVAQYIVDPRLPELPARTLASLQRKGIADDRGLLTLDGVYTALHGGT